MVDVLKRHLYVATHCNTPATLYNTVYRVTSKCASNRIVDVLKRQLAAESAIEKGMC